MAASDNQAESSTLFELLENADSFPIIAEVDQDLRDGRHKLNPGTLLWILRRCQDEVTGRSAVRVATFEASNMEFPILLEVTIMVFKRHYYQVASRMNQMFGPSMSINQVANLAHPGYPVFVVASEDQNRKEECMLIHEKQTIHGYLAKGKQNFLFIPEECEGKFVKTASVNLPKFETVSEISNKKWLQEVKVLNCGMMYNPIVDNIYEHDILKLLDATIYTVDGINTLLFERMFSKIGKIGTIRVAADIKGEFKGCESADDVFQQENPKTLHEFDRQQFPVDVSYQSNEAEGSLSFVMCFDDEILSIESPMRVLGQCSFTATYMSIHTLDPFHDKSVIIKMVSEFATKKVKVRSPMPVHVRDILNFQKPFMAVRALTQEEFGQLLRTADGIRTLGRDRLTTHPQPRNRSKSPMTRKRFQTTNNLEDLRHDRHGASGSDGSPIRNHNTSEERSIIDDPRSNAVSHKYENHNLAGFQRHRPVPAPRGVSESFERNHDRPLPQPPAVSNQFSGSLPDLIREGRKQDSDYMTMKGGSPRRGGFPGGFQFR